MIFCSNALEHKSHGHVALAVDCSRREKEPGKLYLVRRSMIANDASSAWLRRLPRRQQIPLPAIENESQSLMGNSKQASSAGDAALGNFKGAFD